MESRSSSNFPRVRKAPPQSFAVRKRSGRSLAPTPAGVSPETPSADRSKRGSRASRNILAVQTHYRRNLKWIFLAEYLSRTKSGRTHRGFDVALSTPELEIVAKVPIRGLAKSPHESDTIVSYRGRGRGQASAWLWRTGNHNANVDCRKRRARIIRAFPPGSADFLPLQEDFKPRGTATRMLIGASGLIGCQAAISQAKPTLRGAIEKPGGKTDDRFGNACLDADVGEVAVPVVAQQ